MKTLILVRHANAVPGYEARVKTDAERPLSDEGKQKAQKTATDIAARDIKPQIVFTSPLVRAEQTAQILAKKFNVPVSKETVLNGLHSDRAVCAFLADVLKQHDTVVAVGHNPNIAYVTNLFVKEVHPFSPGSFAVLDFEDPHHPKLVYFGE